MPFNVVGGLLIVLLPFLAYVLRNTNLEPHDIEGDKSTYSTRESDPLLQSNPESAVYTEDGEKTAREVEAQNKDEDATVPSSQEATWLGALSQFDVLLSCFLLFMGQVSLGMLWPTLSKDLEGVNSFFQGIKIY